MGIAVVEFKIFFMSFEQCLQLQFSFSVKFEIDITEVFSIRYFILFFCFIHENIKNNNHGYFGKIEGILRLLKWPNTAIRLKYEFGSTQYISVVFISGQT